MVTNSFRADKVKAKFTKQSAVCHPVMNSYFLGGLLLDCKFPEYMVGRERLASCRQWKGQASVPACSGSGKEEGLISLHPEGGSNVHVLCECLFVCGHIQYILVCIHIIYTYICIFLCVHVSVVHAALLLAYDCRFDRNILWYNWKATTWFFCSPFHLIKIYVWLKKKKSREQQISDTLDVKQIWSLLQLQKQLKKHGTGYLLYSTNWVKQQKLLKRMCQHCKNQLAEIEKNF